jgi:hypothetical protein
VVLFAWTALVGSMVLLGPSLILLLIPLEFTRKLYRQWSGFVALMWFAFATFLLERWAKVRPVLELLFRFIKIDVCIKLLS